ncbi:hypothetical protein FACS1894125_4920 [Actinomycetota bacterium]|nr:hypothetical protein FACS1894125_4920 [Actinomycetota bacterium]
MYRAILDLLPHWTLKVLVVLLVLAGVTVVCFLYFFPWLVDYLPYPLGNANFPENPA